jgi:uncharacterized protein YkwD
MNSLYLVIFMLFSCQETTPKTDTTSINKQVLLDLVNQQRSKDCLCGTKPFKAVSPVRWNNMLETAAYKHSKDMAEKNYFSHTGKDGSQPSHRIEKEGYEWQAYGENIYRTKGYDANEEEVIKAWIKSPHHCENIMNPLFTEMAVAKFGTAWTQVFGNPMPKQ